MNEKFGLTMRELEAEQKAKKDYESAVQTAQWRAERAQAEAWCLAEQIRPHVSWEVDPDEHGKSAYDKVFEEEMSFAGYSLMWVKK
jgi:hypothetical protein